ncbi:ent-kaurene oxidase, chloroplastic-like [Papaver somniferum]|uniref:ent-kaurene oxidase, chloroplastic-like n=1 Tax=Papaver somniferum TaxID=3469 RepID=UPI000E700F86|nr:ent-kaurene oxidase, chloroplastic-like [Papaver somniferum]
MGLFVEFLNKPNHPIHFLVIPLVITLVIGFVWLFTILKCYFTNRTGRNKNLLSGICSSPPVVPGLPLLGNLLQLKDKVTHHVFANWAEIYGPIYSIKAGASNIVVLNSTDFAKEAMVTKFSFISKRKQTNAMNKLTNNIIITSDSNEYHKMARRHVVTHMLGAGAQRRHRAHRDIMIDNVAHQLHAHAKENPVDQPVNFRRILQTEIFGLALKQALGVDSVGSSKYVEGLGETLSRNEIFKALVLDPLSGGAEVDWRDFFPYLRWVPNKSFEMHIGRMETRRIEVMKTLIEEQQKRISSGKEINCYLDRLMSEGKSLAKTHLAMLIWETILVASETTVDTAELAMYELAKNRKYQDHLYGEIQKVCGNNKYTEEQFSGVTYLSAVFHETLRRHPPFPVSPLRYVHEDTQLGGYDIPAGTEIAINLYGCNMDKRQWDSPEKWKPERFLDSKYDPNDLYKTMSFGGGKRVCPGALQGLSITCTVIARCIQDFKWSLKPGREEEDINTATPTSQKLNPLLVIVTPRDY